MLLEVRRVVSFDRGEAERGDEKCSKLNGAPLEKREINPRSRTFERYLEK